MDSCIYYYLTAFYISLKRHRPQNTYGVAPMIVVTRAKQQNRKGSSRKTTDTNLESDYSRYSTHDGFSTSAAPSDWSINTEDPHCQRPTDEPSANGWVFGLLSDQRRIVTAILLSPILDLSCVYDVCRWSPRLLCQSALLTSDSKSS